MNTVAQPGRAETRRESLSSSAAWARSLPWLLAGVALVARLFRIEANGLRTDEMYSVWMASRSLPDLLRAIILDGRDATPPTYYVLLHGMLAVSWELWSVRLVSVLAGAALVGLTFVLARQFFDARVATLSALLLAFAPFSIEISRVARAYALTALLTFISLYWFSRLRAPHTPAKRVWLYAIFSLLALSTHYLVGVVVVVQNLIVLALAALGQLPRRKLLAWFKLQAVMGLVALPLIWMALQRVPQEPGAPTGQGWLESPSATGVVKALILWGTGDPSFGPASVTLARAASLLVIGALLGLGALTAWRLWRTRPDQRIEVARIAFIAAAFFGTWGVALGISLVRKIFHEKYFIYLAPLLLILLAWSALRIRPAMLGRGLLAALVALTGLALYVFYNSPNGEQWREAMTYVNEQRQPGDYVVTTPGYYIRPVGYYLVDELAPVDYELVRAPFALAAPVRFMPADHAADERGLVDVDVAVAPAERVWLVLGYTPLELNRLDWFYANYAVVSERDFLGVQVILGEPIEDATVTRLQLTRALAARRLSGERSLAAVGAIP